MKNLQNKYVLITGAAGGIGSILAKQLLQHDCKLLLVDIQYDKLVQLKTDLEKVNSKTSIEIFQVDLTKETEVEKLAQSIKQLDILINNAGIVYGESFTSMSWEKINKILSINLTATIQLTHVLLPLLQKNAESHIVNVASGSGLMAPGGMVAYGASKHGVVGFSEALRAELKDQSIGVSVICPAFVKTNIIQNSEDIKDANNTTRLDKLDAMIQQRGVTPEKIASVIIKAIRHNKGRIVIGAFSKSVLLMKFFFPKFTQRLNYQNYQKLKKQGTLN